MMVKAGIRAGLFALVFAGAHAAFAANAPLDVKIGFIRVSHSRDTISILDIPAPDDGLAGRRAGRRRQ